jgi:high-affinity nickel permease
MLSLLGLAVLAGMHHALEADHLAAVSSLAAGGRRLSDMLRHGLTWGFGHGLTLFLFAGFALFPGQTIPRTIATQFEGAAGLMLVGLGIHVLYRLWRDRIHFHSHRHDDGRAHFHAHSHAGETLRHLMSPHRHAHRFKWRTLLVGMTHGMAGSAALLVLTASRIGSPWEGLAYVLLFGVGSTIGMAGVSAVIGLPLMATARGLTLANRALQAAVGVATIAIGAVAIHATMLAAS